MFFEHLRLTQIYARRMLKYDLTAAIVVFLVAIPLCLGVALACGAPLYSGVISGISGGLVVGFLSQSNVSVSGPSAAIAAVIITALYQLQSFNTLLLAICLSGLIQIYMGKRGGGFFADYIPTNIIQGMLSAIGVLLIIKQVPMALTASQNFADIKFLLSDASEAVSFQPLINLSLHINTGAMLLSILSLGTLLYWDRSSRLKLKSIPAPIVVVIMTTLINEWLVLQNHPYAQHGPHLVNLPTYDNLLHIWQTLAKPDWHALGDIKVYGFALLIAAVTSLETLVNISATERLDPRHQSVDKNQELVAQGIGNVVAGLLGGIPVSSVVVRSSVNIQSQAKTKISTILHGLFLLLSFCLIPEILNRIPLCTLASILIYTGYKLTRPKLYFSIYEQGLNRFIPFIATIIGIVCMNLLLGILLGLLINLFFILRTNSLARIDIIQEVYPSGITYRLLLPQQTTFLNKASIVAELNSIPQGSQLIIDARYAEFIDKEILEYLKEFQNEQTPLRDISLNLIGFKEEYAIHDHINFINVSTYDAQSQLSPQEVLAILKQGNQRFIQDQGIHRSNLMDVQHTSETQHPIAIVLGCIDSRVPVETVFDMTLGDLFCVRVAGNVINDDILASIEYACGVVGAKLIVVLGHTRCGAIQAACDHVKKGHITQLLEKIEPAISIEEELGLHRKQGVNFVDQVTHLNIAHSMIEIYHRSSILGELITEGKIGIIGAVYDVASGQVEFSNYQEQIAAFKQYENHDLIHSLENWQPGLL
jgi:carbonic anhydrase